MRILYLSMDGGIDLTSQGGGAIHVRSLVRALTGLGHQVTVVCTRASSPGSFEAESGAEVVCAPLTPWNRRLALLIGAGNRALGRPARRQPDAVRGLQNLRFLEVAANAAQQLEPDFIYERYTLWGLAGLRLAQARSIPLMLEVNAPLAYEQQTFRSGITFPPFARWVERKIWRDADLVVAVSAGLRTHLATAGVAQSRLRILPNAVDNRRFHPSVSGEAVRRHLHLDGRFVIGFVGTFKKWHGADFLLEAFREIHDIDKATHLLLVGEGPLRARIQAEVERAGLSGAVSFTGAVAHHEMPNYVAAMDVAVAPYPGLDKFYFSPLKLFEYMAAGRPVVASRVGQVAEIVVDGVTGLLFEPGDRAGLVECVLHLQQSAALREELGKKARLACSQRTWAGNAAQVTEWAEALLGPRKFAALSA